MPSNTERHLPLNRARRHFLGVVFSTGSGLRRVAIFSLPARAMVVGKPHGNDGPGHGPKGNGA